MTEDKILNDEILTDEQLDKVAGGTLKQKSEIIDALSDAKLLDKTSEYTTYDVGDLVGQAVLPNYEKGCGLLIGWNELGLNTYTVVDKATGKEVDALTHDQVVGMINSYKKAN